MDRRPRKTRQAIFGAFIALLSEKRFEQITVGEIIEKADVGRATFYSHFETKDYLLKEMCGELFCHIFDAMDEETGHKHIFDCDAPNSVFLHLFSHFEKNDNNILELLSGSNNELFLRYFKEDLLNLIEKRIDLFEDKRKETIPQSFFINHIASTFIETVRWWMKNERKETAERITEYFFSVL